MSTINDKVNKIAIKNFKTKNRTFQKNNENVEKFLIRHFSRKDFQFVYINTKVG